MIDIYICEDNQKELSLFTQYIKDLVSIENIDMEVTLSSSDPYEILQAAALSQNVGLFFLDIDLKSDINGLALAQRIRKLQPRCFIIFITSHSEMGFLTFEYKVEALDFILKDNASRIKSKIHECLLNVNDKYTSINNNIHKIFVINHIANKLSCLSIWDCHTTAGIFIFSGSDFYGNNIGNHPFLLLPLSAGSPPVAVPIQVHPPIGRFFPEIRYVDVHETFPHPPQGTPL